MLTPEQLEELVTLANTDREGMELLLGDVVHDAKSSEASNINNGGIAAQIEYLFSDDDFELAKRRVQEYLDEAKEVE
jgi:hypothetical protein